MKTVSLFGSLFASLFVCAALLAVSSSADARRSGPTVYKRPGMAARVNMGKDFIQRARTVGHSRDGKMAYVVAVDKQGKLWNIDVDLATGRNSTQLKLVEHYGVQDARFFAADRIERGIPAEFIKARAGDVTGRGLSKLTRSHKNLRVALPGTLLGSQPTNLLVGTLKNFFGNWKSTDQNVRFDPADGIPSTRARK